MDNQIQYFLYIVLLLIIGYTGVIFYKNKQNENLNIKVEKLNFKNNLERENPNMKFDINLSKKREFEIKGISESRSKKIIKYISEFGAVTDLNNLKNIKGIGPKTLEDIKKNFKVDDMTVKKVGIKKININKIEHEKLLILGFEKKEIKKLKNWKDKNGIIFSNVDMIEIIGDKRYRKFKDRIKY